MSRWSEGGWLADSGRGSAGDWLRFMHLCWFPLQRKQGHVSVFTHRRGCRLLLLMNHMQYCTCPEGVLWNWADCQSRGVSAYPRLFGRRLMPILSMGGGLTRCRGNSTTLLWTQKHEQVSNALRWRWFDTKAFKIFSVMSDFFLIIDCLLWKCLL